MNVRKVLAFSAAALALPLAAPALAQSTLHVGATVTDPQGGTVGTITSIDGATLMLHTDRHDVRLPVTSFTATDTTVLFGMTQAALDAAVEQAEAATAAGISGRLGAARQYRRGGRADHGARYRHGHGADRHQRPSRAARRARGRSWRPGDQRDARPAPGRLRPGAAAPAGRRASASADALSLEPGRIRDETRPRPVRARPFRVSAPAAPGNRRGGRARSVPRAGRTGRAARARRSRAPAACRAAKRGSS